MNKKRDTNLNYDRSYFSTTYCFIFQLNIQTKVGGVFPHCRNPDFNLRIAILHYQFADRNSALSKSIFENHSVKTDSIHPIYACVRSSVFLDRDQDGTVDFLSNCFCCFSLEKKRNLTMP